MRRSRNAGAGVLGSAPSINGTCCMSVSCLLADHARAKGIEQIESSLEQGRLARFAGSQTRKIGGHFGRYSPEEEKLLGSMPDEELARRLGRTRLSVQA